MKSCALCIKIEECRRTKIVRRNGKAVVNLVIPVGNLVMPVVNMVRPLLLPIRQSGPLMLEATNVQFF